MHGTNLGQVKVFNLQRIRIFEIMRTQINFVKKKFVFLNMVIFIPDLE